MPRRKITLEEAAKAFAEAGLRVKVEAVIPDIPQPEIVRKKTPDLLGFNKVEKVSPKSVKIYLYARHSVGSAGQAVGQPGQETVVGNGYTVYGPGHTVVPAEMAGDLLHQDALARQADDRFLDRTQRQYVLTSVRDTMGRVHYLGREVNGDNFAAQMSPTYRPGYDTVSSESLGSL